ncbi:MAG: T9SS type A sorting domain-containing protein, partial [Bacteroidales bacterium]
LNNQFNIYPNPCYGEVTITLPESGTYNEIIICNIQGKILNTIQTNSNKLILNMGNYSRGIYLIKIISDNKNLVSKIINM